MLYQALIDIENTDGRLMDAMTAQVFFVRAEAKDVLLVPLGALHQRDGQAFVKVQEGRTWRDTPVRPGVKNRTHVAIYETGDTDFLNLLTAQSSFFSARESLIQTELATMLAAIDLYRALGAPPMVSTEFNDG